MIQARLFMRVDTYVFLSLTDEPRLHSLYGYKHKLCHLVRYIVQLAFPNKELPSVSQMADHRLKSDKEIPLVVAIDVTNLKKEAVNEGWVVFNLLNRHSPATSDPDYTVVGLPEESQIGYEPYSFCSEALIKLFGVIPDTLYVKVTGAYFSFDREAYEKKFEPPSYPSALTIRNVQSLPITPAQASLN